MTAGQGSRRYVWLKLGRITLDGFRSPYYKGRAADEGWPSFICHLQYTCKNLANGFKNYFKKRASFPIYKSKKNSKRTYQTNVTNGNIAFNNGCIKLPKLGLIKCSDNYRDSNNKIINVTVSQNELNPSCWTKEKVKVE